MDKPLKIYVASSWKNPLQPAIVHALKRMGHEVYDFRNPKPGDFGFSWEEIDTKWKDWSGEEYKSALEHPAAERGFNHDFGAMQEADCCVMLLPCGRSAHTEAGWMKGASKKVYVLDLAYESPELMYKIYDGIITSMAGLFDEFELQTNNATTN